MSANRGGRSPCAANSRNYENIDSQRPEPQSAGAARHRSLRYADLRNLLRTAPVALSRRRIRLLPVQYRRRVDRRRTAGRRRLRRCGAQRRGIYPYLGGAARRGVGGVGSRRRGAYLVDPRARGVPATSRCWPPWPKARSWDSGWIPTGWESKRCCLAAKSRKPLPAACRLHRSRCGLPLSGIPERFLSERERPGRFCRAGGSGFPRRRGVGADRNYRDGSRLPRNMSITQ